MDTSSTTQEDLRQRGIKREDPATHHEGSVEQTAKQSQDKKKMAMAKRGVRSLSIAVGTPLILALTDIYFFGQPGPGSLYHKPTMRWLPPVWALHLLCLAYTTLMGLSAWLFWAGGGLRKQPDGMYMYLAQMGLSLAWDPLVFKLGANWAGVLVAAAVLGLGWRCGTLFRGVNKVAGDLVLPSLGWAAMVGWVSVKLLMG